MKIQIIIFTLMAGILSAGQKTNILFIAIDDLKPTLGCYGDSIAITPTIDQLAKRGTVFMNAQCQWPVCERPAAQLVDAPKNRLVSVAGGRTVIGKSWEESAYYGWGSEYGSALTVDLEGFEASQFLVSNAEYYEFVIDGGYEHQDNWAELGWTWNRAPGTKRCPLFWWARPRRSSRPTQPACGSAP